MKKLDQQKYQDRKNSIKKNLIKKKIILCLSKKVKNELD